MKKYKSLLNFYNYSSDDNVRLCLTGEKSFIKDKEYEYLETELLYLEQGYIGLLDEQGKSHLIKSINFKEV